MAAFGLPLVFWAVAISMDAMPPMVPPPCASLKASPRFQASSRQKSPTLCRRWVHAVSVLVAYPSHHEKNRKPSSSPSRDFRSAHRFSKAASRPLLTRKRFGQHIFEQ